MAAYLTPEQLAARNKRSLWIALGLVGFIVLIFLTTFLRMQANLAERTAREHAIVAAPMSPAAQTAPAMAAPATQAAN